MIRRIQRRAGLEWKLLVIRVLNHLRFKEFSPENSILVFSDPRGGSTWLAEILENIPGTFIYWEPLSLQQIPQLKRLGFGWRQHIPAEQEWQDAKQIFNKLLAAKHITEWTMQKTSTVQYLRGRLPIVKICRGNDLLNWLVKQYAFKYKPIHLIRHPFAVVASQLKQGGWNRVKGFSIPEMPFNDFYLKHQAYLETLGTPAESLLATWCITNRDLIRGGSGWITLYYEELVLNPEKVLGEVFEEWGLEMPEQLNYSIRKGSSTSVDFVGDQDIMKQLDKWQKEFTEEEKERMQKVLDYFGITAYSSKSHFYLG